MTTPMKDAMSRLLVDEPRSGVDVQRALEAGRTARRARLVRITAVAVAAAAAVVVAISVLRPAPQNTNEPVSPRASTIMYQYGSLLRTTSSDGRHDSWWPTAYDDTQRSTPDVSWDGTRVAFSHGNEIWVARADGSDEHVLVPCVSPCTYADDPAWSPDGTRIAYWTNGPSDTTQVIRIADSSNGRVLQTITADPYLGPVQPRWSPDGRALAVTLGHFVPTTGEPRLDGSGIGLIDLTVPKPRIVVIVPFSKNATYPAWSPQGDRILFTAGNLSPESAGSPGASNLFTVRRDGSGLTQLTNQAADAPRLFEPDWTDNVHPIVVVLVASDGNEYLATVDADGSGLAPILDPTSGLPINGKHPRQSQPSG